ncbi:MAG TPA: serine/threonine-protein kinase, partial [Egibacteraceae bacterium]|nr:serine/threonine-protein kinase [Egibacteraceae bacterium]
MERVLADRYRLRHRIGGGGMGAVFEAEDVVLERTVAAKVLPGVGTGDREFLREARALSRLRHHGIVGLYDAGSDRGDAYLILELVSGQTLRERLDAGPLDAQEAGRVGHELAEALGHAHRLGVVHRDLSPSNVLLDRSGRVRLTDFGIARLSEATATSASEVWGTPAYMAPEQVAGEAVGPPADVYALGLLLLEALTGRRAFPGAPRESGFARLH